MSSQPRISVLLTSYNREDYIAESIESVLAQSVTDFELVICDDRSSDGTVDIINDYAKRDSRIRVSVNERNLGDYAQSAPRREPGAGRFLKYHDSDDVMYPHCLATMVEPLEAEPRAAFALSSAAQLARRPVPDAADAATGVRTRVSRLGPVSAGSGLRAVPRRGVPGAWRVSRDQLLRRLPVLAARVHDGERPARARRSRSTTGFTRDRSSRIQRTTLARATSRRRSVARCSTPRSAR